MKYTKYSVVVSVCLSTIASLASAVSIGNYPAVLTGNKAVLQFNGMGNYSNASYAYNPDHKGKYKETGNTYAGELMYTVDGKAGNTLWCVDIYQNATSSKVSYSEALLTDAGYLMSLDSLYYQYSRFVDDNSKSVSKLNDAAAAFQMALWEITFETGDYNLNNGWFKVSSTAFATSLGNEWLTSLGNISSPTYQKTVWYDAKYQDVIQFGAVVPGGVPEPLTMISMAVAFSAAGGYIAKRLNRSSRK